jgi:Holliday junction resolvase RusA-like endonuclease
MAHFEMIIRAVLKSKARPRSSIKQVRPYMPGTYKKWIADVRSQMQERWVRPPLTCPTAISLTFQGPARHDLDNLCGACLDAGNGIIWVDDRCSVVCSLAARFMRAPIKNQHIVLTVFWNESSVPATE